jgi:NADPH:quinone reductase-like Zn-dependent oxidoreductase
MKAIIIQAYGDASQLKDADVPMPLLNTHDVLIEIYSSSVNAVDWKIRSGYMKDILKYDFPLILGLDIAGVVSEVGEGVTRFKIGDEVLAKSNLSDNGGYAEFIVIDEKLLVPKPSNISFDEAAALPLAGITAWQALTEFAKLKAGERILIQGGAGSVGTLAIQFAKALGATVISTASAKNAELLERLDVDQVIAYDNEDFVKALKEPVDVVFDMVGGEVLARSYEVLVKGGRLVSISEEPNQELEAKYSVSASFFVTLEGGNHLEEVVDLVKEGNVKPVIRSSFSLTADGVQQAHKLIEDGHTYGKVIIKVKG